MSLLGTAIAIAAGGFKDITDKAGEPYILHCLRVMNNPRLNTKFKKIVGVLHDCPEDDIITLEELSKIFPAEIINALQLLDHKHSGLTYDDYIQRLSFNEIATDVKLADLEDNSQITRLKGLGKKDFTRMEKYHRAYVYLSRK